MTDSAKVRGCIYIDHAPNFKLQHGNIDTHALHHHGLHLSRAGTFILLCKSRNARSWDPGQVPRADKTGNIESHTMYTILIDEIYCVDDNSDINVN